ncbi:lytic polysaccharide monooxygenase [Hypoxylon trugodes]|uniref:lytic polysaccharide monooxygenase n=1 Tax=Hypoxylon trugodes TaxID=326681 RepID=UPI0021934DBB|nr:lytic polysaccharide monooxygenase [Hypoxylon trugodes]KAI1386966.1 lytic polysaccharide monooxygenase [Hypoxylon trugodes]
MKSLSLILGAVAVTQVHGHGGIYNYTIAHEHYVGHYPWLPEDGQESIQRRWWPDPIYRTDHPYLACNRGNPLATSFPKLHARVQAAQQVVGFYNPPPCPTSPPVPFPTEPSVPDYGEEPNPMKCSGPEYQWVHSQGPMLVYMADCQGPCDQWDGTGKRWFKIWEAGYEPKGWPYSYHYGTDMPISAKDRWWQDYAIEGGYASFNATIPATLKPGYYLIRHEVINLEASMQFYPECAQLEVTGDGKDFPSDDYLVSFPGAYSPDDPGLKVAGELYNPKIGHSIYNYTIPGPKVWKPWELM